MRVLIVAAALLLSGCATWDYASLQNRIACTKAGDKGLVVSMWGIFGVATIIAAEDAEAVCR